jgi:hypothetical protein
MTMAADDPNSPGELLPRPDPTRLTTDQLRRELSALREILTARLDAMDTATELLSATVNRTPTVIQIEISHVRELMSEKLASLGGSAEERFRSIGLQFAERDTRTENAAKASKEALDAALLAAKELVAQQNEANAQAADKAEQSTIKQIDQIGIRIDTMQKALDDRLTELKERIDRGEGTNVGQRTGFEDSRVAATYNQSSDFARQTLQRNLAGVAISAIAAIISLVAIALLISHGG